MQGYVGKRAHEQGFAGGEFWEVISSLTQDLTRARNQLVRLMNKVKPGGGRLYGGGNGGIPPYSAVPRYTPWAGSNVRNRHRTPAPEYFGCGKEYPHYKSPLPGQPRRLCRPVTVPGASRFQHPQQRPPFACGRPQQRVPYSCERPLEKVQCSCEKPPVPYSCERQQQCDRNGPRDSNCLKITVNDPPPAPDARQRCRRSTTCKASSPARIQGGGRRHHDCIGTQFATLLKDVTCQLRERRLAYDERRFY